MTASLIPRDSLIVTALVLAFGLSAASPFFWRPILRRSSWLDAPRQDRHHTRVVSRIGGICWLTGLLVTFVPILVIGGDPRAPLVLAAGLLLAAGLGRADDVGRVGAGRKWLAQTILLVGSVVLLHRILPSYRRIDLVSPASAGILVLALFVQTALEIFDNMDGVLALVSAASFWVLSAALADPALRLIAAAAAGASLGFLIWNRPPARLFLGNLGSHAVAYLAALLVFFVASGDREGPPRHSASSLITAVPVLLPLLWPMFDLAFVSLGRLARGRPPWQGGRDHTTHRLARRSGSDAAVVLAVAAVSVMAALAALAILHGRPEVSGPR